jgi:hypothetical protein
LEQCNRPLNIVGFVEVKTNLAALRQDVMRLGTTSSDNVVPHLSWKWNVQEMIAMDVAQFTFAQTKFRPAKPMRMRGNIRPTQHGLMIFFPRH